jgi:two-component system, chemotaxis family, chemotaxis protein CheY
MKFLIIDDDIDSCQLLAKRLESYGSSDIATDGNSAFDCFVRSHRQHEPYSAVFLDIVMPEINGHEILVRLREWESENLSPEQKTPVVMVSVMKDTRNIFSSVQEGCDQYMTKPIRKPVLDQVMSKLGFSETIPSGDTDSVDPPAASEG